MSKRDEAINKLADQLREVVVEIEAGVLTTRGHYGTYMGIISKFTDDKGQAHILGEALIKAGANKQGVTDALKVMYG
jgi:RNA binding exosome subunit